MSKFCVPTASNYKDFNCLDSLPKLKAKTEVSPNFVGVWGGGRVVHE